MRTELSLPSSTASKPRRVQPSSLPVAGHWRGSLPTPRLLALVPGLHAGDEGIALVPAVVLIGVVQGHTHALVYSIYITVKVVKGSLPGGLTSYTIWSCPGHTAGGMDWYSFMRGGR